ncbi:MAG: helix-turn-helix domain-containing protein [Clostridia bacterium]
MYKRIGEKIKNLRISKNLTIKELSKAIGINSRTLSDWENAKRKPQLLKFIELINFLNTSLDYLIK